MNRHTFVCLVSTSLALAGAARADNGVIEINQARALAGAVMPGDAPGFPVTLSAAGSYRLTSNLDVTGQAFPANVTAIAVSRDVGPVALDLGGFSIVGATVCSGVPVSSCAPLGSGVGVDALNAFEVSVRNGYVVGMGNGGIRLGVGGAVEEVVVRSSGGNSGVVTNLDGIMLGVGGRAIGVTADSNRNHGITLASGLVMQSVFRGNGAAGVNASSGATVVGIVAHQNGASGLFVPLGNVGYGENVLTLNGAGGAVDVSVSAGLGFANQIGANLCGTDTVCP